MVKISDAIKEIMNENKIFLWGMSNRLFNLSQLSKFMKPLIEARTKKSIRESAILMNLSRCSRILSKHKTNLDTYQLENISVYSDLSVLTFNKNEAVIGKVYDLHKKVQEQNGFISFTKGTQEVTLIANTIFTNQIVEQLKVKKEYKNISAIGVRFSEKYCQIPGLLHSLIQQISLQNINIVEISSTCTEFIFFLEKKDIKLAFETFFTSFQSLRDN